MTTVDRINNNGYKFQKRTDFYLRKKLFHGNFVKIAYETVESNNLFLLVSWTNIS